MVQDCKRQAENKKDTAWVKLCTCVCVCVGVNLLAFQLITIVKEDKIGVLMGNLFI